MMSMDLPDSLSANCVQVINGVDAHGKAVHTGPVLVIVTLSLNQEEVILKLKQY